MQFPHLPLYFLQYLSYNIKNTKKKQKEEMKMKQSKIDMLNGSIGDKLLLFALPLALTGMLQQLFNAADVAVVGQFAGKNAMAAVGSNSAIIGLLVNGFVGIALGANVVISGCTGRGDKKGIHRCVHTAILFSLLGGVCITLIGELFAPKVLGIMSVPEEVFPMAVAYLRIYLLGMPVIFLYNFEAAIFRSQGDTKTPLMCLIVSGVLNVILNLFFVCIVKMTADGVALATVISNLVSATLLFVLLRMRQDDIRLKARYIRIYGRQLKNMVQIGLPAGLQSMVFSLSNICIQSAVNSLGADVMAASAAAFNIEILIYYLLNSFGQAATTFVGQNFGAHDVDRCRRITRICLIMNIGITAVVSLLLLAFGRPLLGIFNPDEAIATIGIVRLRFILLAEVLNAVMEVMSGAMRGYGYSLVPALVTFAGVCGTRIVWVYLVFRQSPTFFTLMMVYPVSWIITASALVIAYVLFLRKYRLAVANKH